MIPTSRVPEASSDMMRNARSGAARSARLEAENSRRFALLDIAPRGSDRYSVVGARSYAVRKAGGSAPLRTPRPAARYPGGCGDGVFAVRACVNFYVRSRD